MSTPQLNKIAINLFGRKTFLDALYAVIEEHPRLDWDQVAYLAIQRFLDIDDIEALVEEIRGELFPPTPAEMADERRLRRWEEAREERRA